MGTKSRKNQFFLTLNIAIWFAVLVSLTIQQGADGRVAVMISPTSSASDLVAIIAHADGVLVSSARVPFIAIAQSSAPDFRQKLFASGAWLVFNPLLAHGCEPVSKGT